MYLSRVYGCVVASDVDLNLAPLAPDSRVELTLRQADDEYDPGWKSEPADLISRYWNDVAENGHLSARTSKGYRLRLDDYCEFDLNSDLDQVVWRVAPGADPGLVPIVMVGGLMTLRLMLAGELVLHSSAVTVNGRGLAFVGGSGMGKSTMAALMCAAGAMMVTDDVGRVIFGEEGVRLAAGGCESRLRPSAESIADGLPQLRTRLTDDGRLALSLPGSALDTVSLDAVVVPLPTREGTEVKLQPVRAAEAVIMLNMFPRLSGLLDSDLLEAQFQQIADLVECVPVFTALIPWGRSFDPAVAAQLVGALGWEPPVT